MPRVPDKTSNRKVSDLPAGTYFAEITSAEEKSSSGGDDYIAVELCAVGDPHDGEFICRDNFMLMGKGRGIGAAKLVALGYETGQEFETVDLIGRRVWIVVREGEYEGEKQLQVDIRAKDSLCGFYPEDSPPPGANTPSATSTPKANGGTGAAPF